MPTEAIRRTLAWAMLVLGLAVAAMGPAAAQLNYGQLLGLEEEDKAPLQSRPQATPQVQPTIEDYGLISETTADPMLDATRQAVGVFRERLRGMIRRLPDSAREINTALAASSPTGRGSYFIGVALFAALLLILGRAISMCFAVYVARPVIVNMQKTERVGYLGKLPILATRVTLTALNAVIIVAVASLVGLFFYQQHEATLITVIVVFGAFLVISVVDTIWRMAVAPYFSKYRIPVMEDAAARSLYRWLSFASVFGILSMGFAFWMQALGLSAEVLTALTVILSLVTVLVLLVMLRRHRRTIRGVLLSGKPREAASWVTLAAVSLWFPFITAYLIFTWGDMSFRLVMGVETSPLRLAAPYGIFMAGLLVYAGASYVIERVFARNREIQAINAELAARRAEEEAAEAARLRDQIAGTDAADIDGDGDDESGAAAIEPEEQPPVIHRRQTMRTMEDLARRTASLFAFGAVAYALIRFWGGPDIFENVPALALLEDLVDIMLIGYIVFHAVRIWIDQKIQEEVGDEEEGAIAEGEGGGAGATRLATLLPLFRNFLLIVIAVTVILLIAMKVGVNVAPLFAGAGIVGLAIGFGAQTLVRDILSGAFFLADDAFRKGEYIDVGEVKGTVEKISLRSFQLRHHLGMLHTIPFGEIQHLTNFSRDWVMMKLPLRLTYDTDVEKVRKMIKKLGLRLQEDPEIGDKFIQPVKSQGVIQMDDSAMIVRIKFMTYPGEQWVLRKRIYAEIRELFEKEGIKFAHREVTVRIPDLDEKKELSEDQVRAIGAAARRVGDQVDEELAGPAAVGDPR